MTSKMKPLLGKVGKVSLCLFGLFAVYVLIGSIDGPMPKDDDLYLPPPPNIPDEQNVRVALLEIFGSADGASSNLVSQVSRQSPYFGPKSPILTTYTSDKYDPDDVDTRFSIKDKKGNVIMAASNRVEFMALVDAAIATNECIAAALARAAERPRYVAKPSAPYNTYVSEWFSLWRHAIDGCGIKDARILLELANKMLNGSCVLTDRSEAFSMHGRAIDRLLEIANREDVDENKLAEIDDLLVKYDLKDWKAFCCKMLREDYSYKKHIYSNYSSLSLTDKYEEMKNSIHVPFPLLNFWFHPNRTLALWAKSSRKSLASLDDCEDDYDFLSTRNALRRHERATSNNFWEILRPNAIGDWLHQSLEPYLRQAASIFRNHRASRLMVACRRHLLKTNKLPETVASISPDILPEPILDPVFNTPYDFKIRYEIKSGNNKAMMHVADMVMEPFGEKDKVVSQKIRLEHITAEEAQKAIEGFKGPNGLFHVLERTNTILVDDTQENVNRMLEAIKELDVATPVTEDVFARQIEYAMATDIKDALEKIVTESQKKTSGAKTSGGLGFGKSAPAPQPTRLLNPINRPGQPPQQPVNTPNDNLVAVVSDADRVMIRGKVIILADKRSNKLIVITNKSNMDFFDKVIQTLDVETTPRCRST